MGGEIVVQRKRFLLPMEGRSGSSGGGGEGEDTEKILGGKNFIWESLYRELGGGPLGREKGPRDRRESGRCRAEKTRTDVRQRQEIGNRRTGMVGKNHGLRFMLEEASLRISG